MKYLLIILILLTSSCISNIDKHGYMFDLLDTIPVEEGVTTKNKILRDLGSPTHISYLDDEEVWLYYSERTNRVLFFKPKILDRKILMVNFDGGDTARKVKEFSLADENKDFNFSKKFTHVKSEEEGFIKGLFGNVGQISAK